MPNFSYLFPVQPAKIQLQSMVLLVIKRTARLIRKFARILRGPKEPLGERVGNLQSRKRKVWGIWQGYARMGHTPEEMEGILHRRCKRRWDCGVRNWRAYKSCLCGGDMASRALNQTVSKWWFLDEVKGVGWSVWTRSKHTFELEVLRTYQRILLLLDSRDSSAMKWHARRLPHTTWQTCACKKWKYERIPRFNSDVRTCSTWHRVVLPELQ